MNRIYTHRFTAHVLLSLLLLVLLVLPVRSQEIERQPGVTAETVSRDSLDVTSLRARFGLNQVAFHNWAEGGVNAVSGALGVSGRFNRDLGNVLLVNEIDAFLGIQQQDTLSVRKTEDQIRYLFAAELWPERVLRPVVALDARSTILPGFVYDPKPRDFERRPELATLPVNENGNIKVSNIGSPLYISQSVGVVYQPVPFFRARAGVGLRETYVHIARLRPLYGNASDQPVRTQAGLDADVRLELPIAKNVLWRSDLLVFQPFNEVGDNAPDTLWDNVIELTVNEFLDVNVGIQTLFDHDQSSDIQLKEAVSLGLRFRLL